MKRKRKSGWHYGVIRKTKRIGKKIEHSYEIHEIFPGWDNGKTIWTETPITPFGETINDLRWALSIMLADSSHYPVYEERNGKLVERSRRRK